jgi:hypothetical protein
VAAGHHESGPAPECLGQRGGAQCCAPALVWARSRALDEFRSRYTAELDGASAAWQPIARAAPTGTVTLLFSSHDQQHNNAVALKAYLAKHSNPDSSDES